MLLLIAADMKWIFFGFTLYTTVTLANISGEICTILNASIDFNGATATPC